MKEQFHGEPKLTVSSRTLYDRNGAKYMSEMRGGAETQERPMGNPMEPDGLTNQDRYFIPPQVRQEMSAKTTFDDIERHLMSLTTENRGEQKSKAYVSAEVLQDKKDWSEYGWDREGKQKVKNRLLDVFGWDPKDDAGRIKNTMENLLATGHTVEDVLEKLTPEQLASREHDAEQRSQRYRGYTDAESLLLEEDFGIREDYVRHFIFDNKEGYSDMNERDFQSTPRNIEELAWQISYTNPGEFGVNGAYPILEMRVDPVTKKDEETGKTRTVGKGRYYVNQANFIRWQRERMNEIYEMEPDKAPNYFGEVVINKEMRSINLHEMFSNKGTMYRSEDNKMFYNELFAQSILEAWYMGEVRSMDVKMKQALGSDEKNPETLISLFYNNPLTKKAMGKNLFYFMSTTPLNLNAPKPGEFNVSDNKVGAAFLDMYLAYYSLSDFEKLQEVLGKDSSFFTKQGMMDSLKKVWKSQQGVSSEAVPDGFLNDEVKGQLKKAFDENGHVTTADNVKAFTDLVNIFRIQNPNENLVRVVRGALKTAVEHRHEFSTLNFHETEAEKHEREANGDMREREDHYSMEMAELMAFSHVRFMGAGARNDMMVAGYDAMTKMMETEQYRLKMIDGRAGSAGNLKTIPLFKRMFVEPGHGLLTESTIEVVNNQGQKVLDKNGKPVKRRRSLHEAFQDIQRVRTAQLQHLHGLETQLAQAPEDQKPNIEREIADTKEAMDRIYQQVAGRLEFKQNAMRHYANDHIARVQKLYKMVMGADEIKFDKFTKHDPIRGITFDRSEFQKVVQEDFLKPIRYAYSTYADLNFNQVIRSKELRYNPKTKKKEAHYKDMTLGESLFGYQVVNRKEFWKTTENGGWAYDEQGRHAIDWDKVQSKDGKQLLWKTWALTKIGADLATHRDMHMTDPAYNFTYYLDVLKALEAIPGAVWGDENDMTSTKVTGSFFSKKDMQWLKGMSKVEWWDLYNREFWTAMFMPKGEKKGGYGGTLLAKILQGIGG